jgi:hypothetical protein
MIIYQYIYTCKEKTFYTQTFDSAFIKANASLDSLVEKEILDDVSFYADEFNEGLEYKVSSTRKKLVERHHKWKEEAYKNRPGGKNISGRSNKIDAPTDENGNLIRPRYLSNHTHYSPTDPHFTTRCTISSSLIPFQQSK